MYLAQVHVRSAQNVATHGFVDAEVGAAEIDDLHSQRVLEPTLAPGQQHSAIDGNMSTEKDEIQVATRISGATYAKIQVRQKEAKRLTGIEPSISAVIRAMIEESADAKANGKRR